MMNFTLEKARSSAVGVIRTTGVLLCQLRAGACGPLGTSRL